MAISFLSAALVPGAPEGLEKFKLGPPTTPQRGADLARVRTYGPGSSRKSGEELFLSSRPPPLCRRCSWASICPDVGAVELRSDIGWDCFGSTRRGHLFFLLPLRAVCLAIEDQTLVTCAKRY
jgi:hypothetical protein